MLTSVVKIILFCLHASLFLLSSKATLNRPPPAVLAFGDSFADSGNNNVRASVLRADFLPYGKDFMGGKPTGRFSNGKNLADYMAEKLGVKEYLTSYLDSSLKDEDMVTGVSFASAGCGFDPLTAKLVNVFSLSDQVEMFKEYIVKLKRIVGEQEASDIIGKSVYLVSCNSNDWAISYTAIPIRRIQYDEVTYSKFLVQKATEFTQELHKLGARNFVYFNTPILGCFPGARTIAGGLLRKCGDQFNRQAKTFNAMLSSQIEFLGSNLPQSKFTVIDYFNIVQHIIQHYPEYGLEVIDRGCCGTGLFEVAILCNKLSSICADASKYLFWDSAHLTDKGYSIVVDHLIQDMMNHSLL